MGKNLHLGSKANVQQGNHRHTHTLKNLIQAKNSSNLGRSSWEGLAHWGLGVVLLGVGLGNCWQVGGQHVSQEGHKLTWHWVCVAGRNACLSGATVGKGWETWGWALSVACLSWVSLQCLRLARSVSKVKQEWPLGSPPKVIVMHQLVQSKRQFQTKIVWSPGNTNSSIITIKQLNNVQETVCVCLSKGLLQETRQAKVLEGKGMGSKMGTVWKLSMGKAGG